MSLKSTIYDSITRDGKPSSSRIFAYITMGQVILSGLAFVGIEVTNAISQFKAKGTYTPSVQSVTVFGMLLAHQLTLLGIYKSNERKTDTLNANKTANTNTTVVQPVNESKDSEGV